MHLPLIYTPPLLSQTLILVAVPTIAAMIPVARTTRTSTDTHR